MLNFVPAVAYLFCLALPEAFTQPGDHLLAVPCTSVTIAIGYMIIFIYMVMAVSICRFGFSFINVINEAGTCLISCHNEEFPQRVNELKLDSCVAFNINYCRQPHPSPEQGQRTRLHVADGLLPLLVAVLLVPGHDLQQPLGAAAAHLRRGHEARQPRHSEGRKFTQPSHVSFLAWIHQSEGVPPSCQSWA